MQHNSQTPGTNSTSASSGEKLILTLEPLLNEGQTALAPDILAGITHIALSQVELLWHNAFNEVTIRKADDLFACAAQDGQYYDAIPKEAELIRATLDIQFAGFAHPHAVDIAPPSTLTLQDPDDAERILPLLSRRGFRC